MKLKDYAQYEDLYFSVTEPGNLAHRIYCTHTGATKENVGARNWSTGGLEWLDPELEVMPLDVPPRPMPPSKSWLTCPNTTRIELLRWGLRYSRQVEAYLAAMEKALIEALPEDLKP